MAAASLKVTLPRHLDVEDLVGYGNVALVNALRVWDPQKAKKGQGSWIWHKVRWGILDQLRDAEKSRRKGERPLFERFDQRVHEISTPAAQEALVMRRELLDAVERLPWRLGRVIRLRYFLEMPQRQAAAAMHISQSRMQQLEQEALGLLRLELGA